MRRQRLCGKKIKTPLAAGSLWVNARGNAREVIGLNEDKRSYHRCSRFATACMGLLFALSIAAPGVQGLSSATKYAGRELVPVGHTIGVKLFSDGVLVVGFSDASGPSPAQESGLKTGDIITSFNRVKIESTEHLQSLIRDNGEAAATLGVRRGERTLALTATPEECGDDSYRLGAWIRDSMAGIGTVTFYDPQSGTFGALGHGIADVDTAQLIPLERGSVMGSGVKAVKRGVAGEPGELRGAFDLTHDCGTLCANTDCGIFGMLTDASALPSLGEAIPIALRNEVKPGRAQILANCNGDTVEAYDVCIEKVYSGDASTRNLLLRVTDDRLIEKTGGIVQGMSGSPIVQNGKLVGAVTHVLVEDPTRGYGIFIENMLAAAEKNGAKTE